LDNGETLRIRRDQLEAIEETVVVAIPVGRAYTGWTEFQSLPVYLSSPEFSRQAPGSHSRTEEVWKHVDCDTGVGPGQRIAWLSLGGNSHTGLVVFSPLDAGNTRVLVRFTWPPTAPAPGITGAHILADLVRYKDFMESLPAPG
jgi:uncharacterized membrane protein